MRLPDDHQDTPKHVANKLKKTLQVSVRLPDDHQDTPKHVANKLKKTKN